MLTFVTKLNLPLCYRMTLVTTFDSLSGVPGLLSLDKGTVRTCSKLGPGVFRVTWVTTGSVFSRGSNYSLSIVSNFLLTAENEQLISSTVIF